VSLVNLSTTAASPSLLKGTVVRPTPAELQRQLISSSACAHCSHAQSIDSTRDTLPVLRASRQRSNHGSRVLGSFASPPIMAMTSGPLCTLLHLAAEPFAVAVVHAQLPPGPYRENHLPQIHFPMPCASVRREKLNVQPTSAHLACRGPSAAQPLAVVLPTPFQMRDAVFYRVLPAATCRTQCWL
jgi:hypothetical protein